MKHRVIFLAGLFLLTTFSISQKTRHIYNVNSERTIEGTIRKISTESRYRNSAPFVMLKLEEKVTQTIYNVEVSPVWFYDMDLHKGEDLEVVGSFYLSDRKEPNLMAREIRFKGKVFLLRDKHGFPNWQGGRRQRKGRRHRKNTFASSTSAIPRSASFQR
jgi:hypothetical protein